MKKHFLLVDDDVAELRLFVDAFDHMDMDYKCTYAKDIDHALKMMDYIVPDSLFVKLDPNVAATLAQIRRITRNKKLKDTKIVVYSENMRYYKFVAREYGAHYCMNKPYEFKSICEYMDGILRA